MTKIVNIPSDGTKIDITLAIPDNPLSPFIEGNGMGTDITPIMRKVVDATVKKPMGVVSKFIGWKFMSVIKQPKSMVMINICL